MAGSLNCSSTCMNYGTELKRLIEFYVHQSEMPSVHYDFFAIQRNVIKLQ